MGLGRPIPTGNGQTLSSGVTTTAFGQVDTPEGRTYLDAASARGELRGKEVTPE
jgi:hypothetical protein